MLGQTTLTKYDNYGKTLYAGYLEHFLSNVYIYPYMYIYTVHGNFIFFPGRVKMISK